MPVQIVRPSKFFRSSVSDLTPNNAGQLKVLLERAMPPAFTDDLDAFCKAAAATEDLCSLVYFNDMPVGAVVCAKEVDPKNAPVVASNKKGSAQQPPNPPHKIVIQALCVLEPYRKLGLATRLIESVVERTNEKTESIKVVKVDGSDDAAVTAIFSKTGFSQQDGAWVNTLNK
ncbi:hypothetical protein HDU80_004094 [Chytriomyces hyalinus]|nr:hypothetical protein HDU80_004094 [Chytriomyces hyalinus]